MKVKAHLIALFVAVLVPVSSAALRESPKFDEYYTIIGIKAENKRLDNYAIQLNNSPGSRGIILVYARDETSAKSAQARARRAVKYLVKIRGVDAARVTWKYECACVCNHEMISLYLLYPNQADPMSDPSRCSRSNTHIQRAHTH